MKLKMKKIKEKERCEMSKEKELENEEVDAHDESEVEHEDSLHRLFDRNFASFHFVVMKCWMIVNWKVKKVKSENTRWEF